MTDQEIGNTLDDAFPMNRDQTQREDMGDAINAIGNILLDILVEVKNIHIELKIIRKGVENE